MTAAVMIRTWTRMALGLLALAPPAMPAGAPATQALELRQGTDISVTVAPGGARVIGLAGRLWSLPTDGGDATAITPAGEYARRPAFSPDGGTLAWEALRDGHFHLVIADADGGHPRQLTSGPWHHLAPAWSADGQRLAMASDRSGDFGIWLLQRDSGALTQLSFERGDELDPVWDPAGDGLAYVSEAAGRSALVLRTPTRPRQVLVDGTDRLRGPAWRPGGGVISFVGIGPQGGRLNMVILSSPPVVKPLVRGENAFTGRAAWLDRNRFLYAADGQLRQRELGAPGPAVPLPFRAVVDIRHAPEPAPRHLAEAGASRPVRGLAGLAPLPDGHLIVSALGDLREIDGEGRLIRNLTPDAFADRDPATSADGRWLAYISDRSGNQQVWLMDLASGTTRQLTAEPGTAARPALDPGAAQLAYLLQSPGEAGQRLRVLALADGRSRELAENLILPGTPAWSPDGTRLALVQDDGGSRRLLLFTPAADGGPRRVTLPGPAAAPGRNEAAWSPDGQALAIASAAGIRVLPMLADGLAGADWQSRHDDAVQLARWTPGAAGLLFTDGDGLARVGTDRTVHRIPIALDWQPAQGQGRTVIRAGRLFDGNSDSYLHDQQVVVEGNRIVAVGPWSDTAADGATLIDARRRTVIPGLIDLGLQLPDAAGERIGRLLLAFGITTAQVLSATDAQLREVAERWQSHAAGPRLLASPEWCNDPQPEPDTAGVMVGALRLCPVVATQPATSPPAWPGGLPLWSAHWLAAGSGLLTAVSPLRPAAGRPADEGLLVAPSPYQDAMDIMLGSGTTLIPSLAARGLPVLVEDQPALLAAPQYLALVDTEERQAAAGSWRSVMASEGVSRRAWLRDTQRLLARYAAGGGHLAAASGAPAVPYGLGLHAELRLAVAAGLPRGTVLRAATAEAARSLGLQEDIGTLAPGRRADLLVIDGDPLASLDQLLRIEMVMIDGARRPMSLLAPEQASPSALEKFTPAQPATKPKRGNQRR